MNHHYRNYYWKKGVPRGIDPADAPSESKTYKIVCDPYYRHISIETYAFGQFSSVIYDSKQLDFRHLKPMHQVAWSKDILSETPEEVMSLIRDGDDRVVLKEIYRFDNQLCRECAIYSPFGILLAKQKMFYLEQQDPFNGVALYDINEQMVMYKRYAMNDNKEFTEVLEEVWDNFTTETLKH